MDEDQILDGCDQFALKYPLLDKISFYRGATWANAENEKELATLRAENTAVKA